MYKRQGFPILVGRNNAQNDRLTLKTARGRDVWFHVKNAPGSHAVVLSGGQPVTDTTKTVSYTHLDVYKRQAGYLGFEHAVVDFDNIGDERQFEMQALAQHGAAPVSYTHLMRQCLCWVRHSTLRARFF